MIYAFGCFDFRKHSQLKLLLLTQNRSTSRYAPHLIKSVVVAVTREGYPLLCGVYGTSWHDIWCLSCRIINDASTSRLVHALHRTSRAHAAIHSYLLRLPTALLLLFCCTVPDRAHVRHSHLLTQTAVSIGRPTKSVATDAYTTSAKAYL